MAKRILLVSETFSVLFIYTDYILLALVTILSIILAGIATVIQHMTKLWQKLKLQRSLLVLPGVSPIMKLSISISHAIRARSNTTRITD